MGAIIRPTALTALLLLLGCSAPLSDTVNTSAGPVKGVVEDGFTLFRGIPYAAPPVGDLRWRAPQPAIAWSEPLQANSHGPACWQDVSGGNAIFMDRLTEGAGMGGFSRWLLGIGMSLVDLQVSEDCLTLNVIAPQQTGEPLPVMFWIHGGGHQFGDGGQAYESTQLAGHGVVLVTINYRLGIFGFMAHPELAAEDPNQSSGNYGMLDQIAALRWVQDNIAAFGGDPTNVTLFGESAGGHSVGQLMASPLTNGLFHRAIAQSGTGFYQFQAIDQQFERMSGFEAGQAVARMAGVEGENEIAALRGLSTDQLAPIAADAAISATFHPQIDGYVLPRATAQTFSQGQQAPVPLIVGSNADEGSVLYHFGLAPVDGGPVQQPDTAEQWDALLRDQFGALASEVDAAYLVDDDADVGKAAEQMMGDSWFGRHAFYMAQMHSAAGYPAYLYFYERRPPTDAQSIGASHALELNHVFGGFIPLWPADARDDALTAQMQSYWSTFARFGDPNGDGATWPQFNDLQPQEMAFGHDQTQSRPVAREQRYRAMYGQLQQRLEHAWEDGE